MDFLPSLPNRQTLLQLFRYAIVGVAQNGVGYGIYIFFTWLGADPKLVVAISYPIAMLVSFLGNRTYTFSFSGAYAAPALKFIFAHVCSYAINLLMLWIFVDIYGYPHQLVQLAAIFVCALFLFLMLKFFVFRKKNDNNYFKE